MVGNVIRRDNPEAQALLASDIPRLSLPEALNRFLVGERQSLVVAGTHGKTTTTALIAWLLYALGMDPGFMVGGIARNFQANYRVGRGPYVVLEGDEYDTAFFDKRPKFVHFRPRVAVLTSIEFDHADIYTDLDHVIRAFESYLETVAPDGRVLAWGDAPLVRQVCRERPGAGLVLRGRPRLPLAGGAHHPGRRRHAVHRPSGGQALGRVFPAHDRGPQRLELPWRPWPPWRRWGPSPDRSRRPWPAFRGSTSARRWPENLAGSWSCKTSPTIPPRWA